MNPQAMDHLIDVHLAAEKAGDTAGAVSVYTDDVEHDVVGAPHGPLHGRAAAEQFYKQLTSDTRAEEMRPTHRYYGDDFCVIEHVWTGTVPGSFFGIPGHGRRISHRLLHVWEFRDGRISRENVWLDGASVVAQLTAPADLPVRVGPRPTTSAGLPRCQLDQQPPDERLREKLAERVFALPGVSEQPSGVSVPGARALVLAPPLATGPREAFFVGQEFAHLHPGQDHSLHLSLPGWLAQAACEQGWAEPHPAIASRVLPSSMVMVYAPRNEPELHVVADLVQASYRFATGRDEVAHHPAAPINPT